MDSKMKIALVTGGSRGLGRDMVLNLADRKEKATRERGNKATSLTASLCSSAFSAGNDLKGNKGTRQRGNEKRHT